MNKLAPSGPVKNNEILLHTYYVRSKGFIKLNYNTFWMQRDNFYSRQSTSTNQLVLPISLRFTDIANWAVPKDNYEGKTLISESPKFLLWTSSFTFCLFSGRWRCRSLLQLCRRLCTKCIRERSWKVKRIFISAMSICKVHFFKHIFTSIFLEMFSFIFYQINNVLSIFFWFVIFFQSFGLTKYFTSNVYFSNKRHK